MTDVVSPMSVVWEGEKPAFAKAFIIAQKAMESIKKGTKNDHFKSKYADLAEVASSVIPPLNEAGIGVLQFPAFDGEIVTITTTFLHESGASVTGVLNLRPSKNDPQGVGSATTYGRRYSLLAMTGTAPEDDDGNAASGPRQEQQRRDPPRQEQHRPAALVAAEAAILLCDTVEACDEWSAKNKAMLDGIDDDNVYQAILRCWKNRRAALAPAKVENRAANRQDFNPAELEGAMA